jgi:predicted transcriptional regulator
MIVTQADLDGFHQFASEQLDQGSAEISWDEIFVLWESRRDRAQVSAAIRRGLADVEAGRHRPAEEALRDLSVEFGPYS